MNRIVRSASRLIAASCLCSLAACGGGGGGTQPPPPLTITPTQVSLDPGMTKAFLAGGGTAPYTYSIASGNGTIDATSGTYTAPASAGPAVVRTTDSAGQHADSNVTVNAILTLGSQAATVDGGTSQTLMAAGGQPPYRFSILSGAGTVDAASGVYTAPAGAGTSVVLVTDALGANAQVTIVNNPQLLISPASLTVTAGAGQTYPFTGQGGTPPYSYSLVSGPGSTNASGVYTAVNTSGTAIVRVTDGLGVTADATVRALRIRVNNAVSAAVTDGTSWYLGGTFTAANPYSAPRALVIDSITGDPKLACDLQSGFLNGIVSAIVTSPTAIYVGGQFDRYRGTQVGNLVKIDPTTCALDATFNQGGNVGDGMAAGGAVSALLLSGNSLYVAGAFNVYRGTSVRSVIKIDAATGALDPQFAQAAGAGAADSLALVGNALYVGGAFTTYDGAPAAHLAKVDATTGHVDPSFGQGSHPDSDVVAIVPSGGSLYIGGLFKHYGSATASISKIDATTGVLDPVFMGNTSAYGSISSIAISGSSLFVGLNVFGSPASFVGLAKLDATTGATDFAFSQPGAFDQSVSSISVSGGSLYVGGYFHNYRSAPAYGLAKIDATTGALDATFTKATGTNDTVTAIAFSGSNIVIGGPFSTYRGTPVRHLAKMDIASDTMDPSFTALGGADGVVYSLALSNGALYVGGNYTSLNGHNLGGLGKVDPATGAVDPAFAPVNQHLDAHALLPYAGSLYVGGSFATYNNQTTGPLVKVNPATGIADSAFVANGPGSGAVYALAGIGSSIYLGGQFTTGSSAAVVNVAKVDALTGSLDAAFSQSVGTASPPQVYALAAAGSSLYVGGFYPGTGGELLPALIKVDSTSGVLDPVFPEPTGLGPNGRITALTLSGSSLYLGGVFSTYHTADAENLAKIDATSAVLDTAFTTTPGVCGASFDQPQCGGNVASLSIIGSRLYVGSQDWSSSYRGSPAYFFFPVDLATGVPLDP
jgi:hypothetical protein